MAKTKKSIHIVWKAILIYISSGVLGVVFSELLGKLYRYIEGPYKLGTTIDVLSGEELNNLLGGFMFGYLFFAGLLIALFIKRKFWLVWLIAYALVIWMSWGDLRYLIYDLSATILGFLIGKLILEIYKKVKNKT